MSVTVKSWKTQLETIKDISTLLQLNPVMYK